MMAFPEPQILDGLFDAADGIEPRYCYQKLNRREGYTASAHEGDLVLKAPYDVALIDRLKGSRSGPRARWSPEAGVWRAWVNRWNAAECQRVLEEFGVEFGDDVRDLLILHWKD